MATLPGTRVLVTGLPGSGKTTLAMALSARDALSHIEVDRLYYGPNFHPRETFVDELGAAMAGARWCLDDVGLPESRELTWSHADTVVWLDLPYGVAAKRAVRRTWRRLKEHREVLPGCRESWLGWATRRHPVFLSVTAHGRVRRAMERRIEDPAWSHLQVIRLRSVADVVDFLGAEPALLAC